MQLYSEEYTPWVKKQAELFMLFKLLKVPLCLPPTHILKYLCFVKYIDVTSPLYILLVHQIPVPFFFFFFLRFYLFLEAGEEREREREKNINVWLPLTRPLLGTWPTTQACALTGNLTRDPLICRPALNHWAPPARVSLPFFTGPQLPSFLISYLHTF